MRVIALSPLDQTPGFISAWRVRPFCCSLLLALAPALGQAQTWTTQAAVQANLTATNNAELLASGSDRKDLITTVRPTFSIAGESAAIRLNARIGADLVDYARRSQPNRVSPVVRADLNATLAERLFFLDSSVDVHQAEIDPYSSRAENSTTSNRRTSSTYRISPYLNYEFSPQSSVLARHAEAISRSDSEQLTNQRFSTSQVRADYKGAPFGGYVTVLKDETRFADRSESDWSLESFKSSGDVLIGGELVVGPSFGAERSKFLLEDQSDSVYGAHVRWNPGARTQLAAEVERRFFGTGWDLSLRHRTPFMTFAVLWNRAPVTSTTSVGVVPAGADLSAFLSSILTTRYPNPAERSAFVSNLVASRGLNTNVPGAIDIMANYAQLQNRASASWVLLGPRNTVTLSVYRQTLRQLTRADSVIAGMTPAGSDNQQTGATLSFNRRLTPQMSAELNSTLSKIRGLALREGDVTDQQTHRMSLSRSMSPRSTVSMGLQYTKFDTTLIGLDSYTAIAAFVGLNHRF
ncbi:MAG: TIGR03016 family PEP-CTERM system-associated outer membrane protein [Burkholderiaceae bacterium]